MSLLIDDKRSRIALHILSIHILPRLESSVRFDFTIFDFKLKNNKNIYHLKITRYINGKVTPSNFDTIKK